MKKKGLIVTGFHVPYNPNLKQFARKMRKKMTEAEKKLWDCYLKNSRFRFLRQKPLDNYIADFYCPKLKLVIEVDGGYHNNPEIKKNDELRTRMLEGYGLRVLRFSNEEVMNDFAMVCRKIEFPLTPL